MLFYGHFKIPEHCHFLPFSGQGGSKNRDHSPLKLGSDSRGGELGGHERVFSPSASAFSPRRPRPRSAPETFAPKFTPYINPASPERPGDGRRSTEFAPGALTLDRAPSFFELV